MASAYRVIVMPVQSSVIRKESRHNPRMPTRQPYGGYFRLVLLTAMVFLAFFFVAVVSIVKCTTLEATL